MQFTQEQIEKAKQAKSAEELFTIAGKNGMELTEEEAKKYFSELHKEGELSDDELDAVAGGKDGDTYDGHAVRHSNWKPCEAMQELECCFQCPYYHAYDWNLYPDGYCTKS